MSHDTFPYGPRQFKEGDTPLPAPRSMSSDIDPTELLQMSNNNNDDQSTTERQNQPEKEEKKSFTNSHESAEASSNKSKRRKRSLVVADRKVRSADVGVSGLYEVISEADLAFSPDARAEAVTVFQGRIREEVVYGICMPVPGFSILFVLVAVSAVVSALVAGSLLYRYQLQKEQMAERAHQNGAIAMSSFANWMGLRLLKPRAVNPTVITDSNGSVDNSIVLNSSMNKKTEDEHTSD